MIEQASTLDALQGLLRIRLSSLARRSAFAALVVLGAMLAFEMRSPVARLGGLQLTGIEMLIGLTLLLWAADRVLAARMPQVPIQVAGAVGVWLAVLLISALLAPSHRAEAFLFLARIIAGILVGWAAFDLADSFSRQRMVAAALVVCGAGVALLGLAEGVGSPQILAWLGQFKESQTRIGDIIRISSTLSYATIAAMILELTLPPALALALTVRSRWQQWLIAAAIFLILVTLVFTLSRAGIVALLAALGVMALYGFRWRHRVLMAGSLAAGAALIALVLLVLVWNPLAALRLSTESEQQWYRASFEVQGELRARPNEVVAIPVLLTNAGARAWEGSSAAFALSYHLYTGAGEPVTYDGPRTPLPAVVQPGDPVEIQAVVVAPAEPGSYQIEWDLLQENITWFSWKGNTTPITRLVVAGAPLSSQIALPDTAPPTDVRIVAPTPERSVLWQAALQMALRRPLLGVGPDNFRWLYGSYVGLSRWNTAIHANNLYLEWLAGTGILGLAAFLWFSWKLFAGSSPGRLRAASESQRLLALAFYASLAAWYIHGLFDYFYEFTPTYVGFWLIAGLALRVIGPAYAHRD